MKKVLIGLMLGGLFFLFACRHEILNPAPVDPAAGGGTGGTTPEVCFDDVLPIFRSSCAKSGCHNTTTAQEGYVLDSYAGIIKKGLKPGNAGGSKIYQVLVTSDNNDRMPMAPYPRLLPAQIELIRNWINQGAKNNTGCATTACDTTVFTYTAIKKIIDANCLNCHSGTTASGGWNFSAYTGLKTVADNGKLWGSVSQTPGFQPMPMGNPKLPDCQIIQIKKWIQDGAPNN